MGGEWGPIRLGDVCTKIGSGATPRGGSDVYLSSGPYALIRSQNVYNDGFHHDGLAFIGEQHASQLTNVEVLEGDVLLNITGDSVARACQVDPRVLPARVNQHVAIIRPDPGKLDPRFLRYFLVSPEMQTTLLSWAGSGGTRNALTKGMIESFEVLAPGDIDEQRAIAHILGTLDDKIELNRRMSETLEAMARALFKSWFVDFDPVRAKIEGRWQRGQSLPGLPAHLYDLFPDRLVDSELGEIPEGWEVVAVGDVVDIVKGVSYRSEDLADSDVALVTLKSFTRGGGYRTDGLKPFIGLYKPEQEVRPGELIVAQTDVNQAAEVIGKPALVLPDSRFQALVASLDVLIIRPIIPELPKEFFYLLFLTPDFQEHIYGHTNGTTVLHLGRHGVPTFRFVRPFEQVGRRFSDILVLLFGKITRNAIESRTLAALRDALLPKLISGEIRVKDAERFLKERGL